MGALAQDNMTALGLDVVVASGAERLGSSDMGNVRHVVPAIHPYIAIGPEELVGHSPEFREAAGSPAGHKGLILAAKTLAMTAVDLLAEPAHIRDAHRTLKQQKRQ